MWTLYNLAVKIFFKSIRFAAIWRKDAKLWVEGRKNFFENLESLYVQKIHNRQSCLWIHVASLGEFEQGRPLIEKIRSEYPGLPICLSFFSPSGYEIRKNYEGADLVCYFPSDLKDEISRFIDLIRPLAVIFVKYDFWFNTLRELTYRHIPYYFISVHLPEKVYLRKSFMSPLLNELKNAEGIFVQQEEDLHFFLSRNFARVWRAGDTRIDRVLQLTEHAIEQEAVEQFIHGHPCLIAGSAWLPELHLISQIAEVLIASGWKIIIATHHTDEEILRQTEELFRGQCCRYGDSVHPGDIMIIDRIGLLNTLYRYAHLALVGGGFGKGIHNTLEPAAFGIPLCFGPNYEKFIEANDFVRLGIARVVKTSDDLLSVAQSCLDVDFVAAHKKKIGQWMHDHQGATQFIFEKIQPIISRSAQQATR
ncbi:MAG: glycosyltransferase N-terminal domain-containing protein [Saprospiraceae bacterium]